MAPLYALVEQVSTITSSTTSVDYNDEDDHEYDDAIPSLLVFELQESVRPPSNVIANFGANNKLREGCGRDFAISATGFQSVCTILAEGKAKIASDNDFNTEHLIPSLIHCINITSDSGDSIYSGIQEG